MLSGYGIEIALLSGFALCVVAAARGIGAARRRTARSKAEAERLRDEIWELRATAAARDRAEAANEAKSRFLATVSHEVRTPLNGILGMAELLAGTEISAEQATYVAAIQSSGTVLTALIDEILDFSKIEAGRVEFVAEPFDLVALVEGVVELLAPRAQSKRLEIAGTLALDVPRTVVGDAFRLRQILLNLAGNAVKFTDRGGVGLRVRRSAPEAQTLSFDVVDTGPGVPPDRRAAIFDEFEQADSSTTRRHGGSGLGLSISRRLAERMGGTLVLAATAEGAESGAIFTVTLPLPAGQNAPDFALPPGLRGKRALIASTSPFETPFLAARLEECGVLVSRCGDPSEASAQLAGAPPFDLVIVDGALGEEATRAIGEAAEAAGARQRLVLFSPFERRAFEPISAACFDGWLVKPVRRQSFFSRLDRSRQRSRPAKTPVQEQVLCSGVEVLLAEDNEINALLATRHLQRLGLTVRRAADGPTALALAEAAMTAGAPFSLVVLDIRMPGLDGLAVARAIRLAEAARGLAAARLIALSADVHDADRCSAAAAGIDDFLGKPVSFSQFVAVLGGPVAAVA